MATTLSCIKIKRSWSKTLAWKALSDMQSFEECSLFDLLQHKGVEVGAECKGETFNRSVLCMFWKDFNLLTILFCYERRALDFFPPLKCFAHRSISELNLLLSEQPRGWVRMVQGKQGVETGWLDATISFVTGSEEQRQWLLQFVVLVNRWIGTGLLLWWDPCSYMWNKASSQKEGNSLLSIHGWPFSAV